MAPPRLAAGRGLFSSGDGDGHRDKERCVPLLGHEPEERTRDLFPAFLAGRQVRQERERDDSHVDRDDGGGNGRGESESEQAAAGLTQLTSDERDAFNRYNAAYRERFGFPFAICARQNRKDAILAAFPRRLTHGRDAEIATAIEEICRIAHLRLLDAVSEEV